MAILKKKKTTIPNTTPSYSAPTNLPSATITEPTYQPPSRDLTNKYPNIEQTGALIAANNKTNTINENTQKLKGGTYQGGTMSLEEYKQYKSKLGFGGGSGGKVSQAVLNEVAKVPGTREYQQAQDEQRQAAVSQLGLSQEQIAQAQMQGQEAPINIGQAVTAGFANVAPSAIGGAVGGAAIGAVAGGVGSIPGAVVGGVGGFLTGFFNGVKSNIKSQQSGEIASTKKVLTAAKTNMRQLAILASKDPANAVEYIQAYNQQLENIYTAQAKLKRETSGNLNAFMEDGTQDLAEFDLFLSSGGLADIYKQKLQMALISGVPLDFTAEDLAMYSGDL